MTRASGATRRTGSAPASPLLNPSPAGGLGSDVWIIHTYTTRARKMLIVDPERYELLAFAGQKVEAIEATLIEKQSEVKLATPAPATARARAETVCVRERARARVGGECSVPCIGGAMVSPCTLTS